MVESSRFLQRAQVTDTTRSTFAGRVFSELVASGLVGNLRPQVIQALAHVQEVSDNSSEFGIKIGNPDSPKPGTPGRTVEAMLVVEPTLGSKAKDSQMYPQPQVKVEPKLQAVPKPAQEYCDKPCSVWHYVETMMGNKYYFSCGRSCKKTDLNHHTCDCNCYSNHLPPYNEIDWGCDTVGRRLVLPPGATFVGGAKSERTPGQRYKKRS